ncbi:hypothetical protein DMH17_04235 [Raoultella planticola]|nr:hypothetical protein [Raoultella planticola]
MRWITVIARKKNQYRATAGLANAELCVPQTIDAGASGRAVVNLKRFDLAMLKPFMPEATSQRRIQRQCGCQLGHHQRGAAAG